MDKVMIVDTSFLSDLSRRMLWTFHAVAEYIEAGEPKIIIPQSVKNEYHNLLSRNDSYGIPKASLTLEAVLEKLGSNIPDTDATYFKNKIFRAWKSSCPKKSRYSIVDERIMKQAVSLSKQGTRVIVATADSDIIYTLQSLSKIEKLPVTILKPDTPTQERMAKTSIDMIVTGTVLDKIHEEAAEGSRYIEVAQSVKFGEKYFTDIAIDVISTGLYEKPNEKPGKRFIRILQGKGTLQEAMIPDTYIRGQFAVFYPETPGSLRIYEPTNGRASTAKHSPHSLEIPLTDPDKKTIAAKRWARVDPDFVKKFVPYAEWIFPYKYSLSLAR
ncbi:hypothetical protein HYU11_06155 [Candidatus Woesearchaeota archaeon]|nr:hypothetical protein [Candidatus Woesearchaeota archaeon]